MHPQLTSSSSAFAARGRGIQKAGADPAILKGEGPGERENLATYHNLNYSTNYYKNGSHYRESGLIPCLLEFKKKIWRKGDRTTDLSIYPTL